MHGVAWGGPGAHVGVHTRMRMPCAPSCTAQPRATRHLRLACRRAGSAQRACERAGWRQLPMRTLLTSAPFAISACAASRWPKRHAICSALCRGGERGMTIPQCQGRAPCVAARPTACTVRSCTRRCEAGRRARTVCCELLGSAGVRPRRTRLIVATSPWAAARRRWSAWPVTGWLEAGGDDAADAARSDAPADREPGPLARMKALKRLYYPDSRPCAM